MDEAAVGDEIGLNLYPDVTFTLILERKQLAQPDGYTWSGRLRGIESGGATLAVGGGQMAANISAGLAQYQVRYAGDGVYAIHTIDQSKFPAELPPKLPVDQVGRQPSPLQALVLGPKAAAPSATADSV